MECGGYNYHHADGSYRFSVFSSDLPDSVADIKSNGNGFVVKLKFNLQKILKAVFTR